tara:strand:+ start:312 stop:476 length:165 start_codon:yes stop_codon:yes gene_type:complete
MMTKFEMKFADENGNWSHDEIVTGEIKYVFAWVQGYLKAGNYTLQSVKMLEVIE